MDLRDPFAPRVSKMDLKRNGKPSAPFSPGAMKNAVEESPAGLHTSTLQTRYDFTWKLYDEDKYDEALPTFRRVLEERERVLGEENRDTLITGHLLAFILHGLQKFDEALPTCRRVLEARKRVLGEDHRETLETGNLLAVILHGLQKDDEALPTCRRVLETRKRVLGEDHHDTLDTGDLLARIQLKKIRRGVVHT